MATGRSARAKPAPADVVARCRELAKELIDEARRGFKSGDDPAMVKRKSRWIDLRLAFTGLVSQSERALDDWVAKRTLSAEAAETLLEARDEWNHAIGFPGIVDPGKRRLIEPLARFVQLSDGAQQSVANASDEHQFCEDGQFFRIRFGDESGSVRNLVGGQNYRRLLQNPGVPISCAELVGATVSVNGGAVVRHDAQEEFDALKLQIQEYNESIESETSEGQRCALENERDALQTRLLKITNLRGGARTEGDSYRTTISNRMRDFREACRKWNLATFADFLEKHVDTGRECCYRPPVNAPEWTF